MIKSIYDTVFEGKKVLLRVDFNVPLNQDLEVTDDNRIRESLPTIDKIIDDGGLPIVMSHLGRPKGESNPKFSLRPVAEVLKKRYGFKVHFAKDCIGKPALDAIRIADAGSVVLLENLRFHKEEEMNDNEFAKQLASLADVYVNDAFGSAHRAHSSTYEVTKFFSEKYAGKLLLDEIEYLGKAISNPVHPFTAVIGGAKISGKIDVIRNLMTKCDTIILGGGMMYTFFKAMGYEIGKSIVEEDKIELAKELLQEAKSNNVKLLLPVDVVVSDAFSDSANSKTVKFNEMPKDWMGMDIGEETQRIFIDEITKSKTIFWNGPMGVFEMNKFSKGTRSIANSLADATHKGAISIVGGGDSAAAVIQMHLKEKITHISTGGGASLEFLEGKELPGIAALQQ
ncbi:MAG TPA: phosphoglycerate kinase [Candidatus Kapabacteria bacterium]|nr:phosphoglycerate kinase [Candidatus Kapabacteria bacterium]